MPRFDITERFPTSAEVHDQIDTPEVVINAADWVDPLPAMDASAYVWQHHYGKEQLLRGWFLAVRQTVELYTVEGYDDPETGPAFHEVEPNEIEAEQALQHIAKELLGDYPGTVAYQGS